MLVLYILINDIPSMSPGRACAQASHAANAFIKTYGSMREVKLWQKETPQGFGTAIVLRSNESQIDNILNDVGQFDASGDWVIDPDYRIIAPPEIYRLLPVPDKSNNLNHAECCGNYLSISLTQRTCAYVFGDKEKLAPLLKHLPLY